MIYKIIGADPTTGQITVEYSHNGSVVGVHPIDVPIVNGVFITGTELDAEIMARAPLWMAERVDTAKAAANFDSIAMMVVLPTTVPHLHPEQAVQQPAFVEVPLTEITGGAA
jgi:hypothetical protein